LGRILSDVMMAGAETSANLDFDIQIYGNDTTTCNCGVKQETTARYISLTFVFHNYLLVQRCIESGFTNL
jgi:hypothetical protein